MDRLRELGPARLAAPADARSTTVGQLGHQTADALAAAAERLEARAEGRSEVARAVPDLAVRAVGDQVAVTGHDLLAALDAEPDPAVRADVASAAGRRSLLRLLDALP